VSRSNDAIPMALTIAGSDSSGGAGVQADLRTFAALGVYGASAITAITAQSTTGVYGVHLVPSEMVLAQIDAVLADLPIRVVKTGMLASAATVRLVADRITSSGLDAVVDPVIVSSSGTRLLSEEGEALLLSRLFPAAALVTPNVPEAEALLGAKIASESDLALAARALVKRGAKAALVKGGHLIGDPVDVLADGENELLVLRGSRIDTRATHGTGCTYASAIAALLSRGLDLRAAVCEAHAFVRGAIASAAEAPIGQGSGPLHQLHKWYAWNA
jgi:hydroxymethylpyrimidine/phosphomethylpyrimidine kinase